MNNQETAWPRVCVLTQTASEVRPYYREFFAGLDFYFVTFKQKNPDAVDFLPGSTWSDGRNRLWEHVKGKYDYYLFIDDDLEFFCLPTGLPTTIERLLMMKMHWQEKLGVRGAVKRLLHWLSYQKADPARFRTMLYSTLRRYRPPVATVALTSDIFPFDPHDRFSLHRSRRVRPLGWFDAQVTIFSNVGGHLLLPYDTKISGWWSSQIPIYVLAHLAFKDRAINIMDLASANANHTLYRPDYDGFRDCLAMSEWLTPGILDPNCDPINLADGSYISHEFGFEYTKTRVRPAEPGDRTLEEALLNLSKSFDLHHPYIYDRHRELVDEIEARSPAPAGKAADG